MKNIENYSLYNGNNITYGEMDYEGIQQLYSYLTKNYNSRINSFIDIGSGRGKLCMYMAAQPKIIYVLGIELVKQRHDDAEILKSEIDHEFANKVTLINKNFFDIDFNTDFEYFKNTNIFIWFSNLCFDLSVVDDIFKKIQTNLPKGTFVCCSKKPSENFGEFLNVIQVPMSWNKASNVYIYRL